MCIRDSDRPDLTAARVLHHLAAQRLAKHLVAEADPEHGRRCLLYTSDAADERSSVDLGGRRIIKKKQT